MAAAVTVRRATREDMPAVLRMIHELAEYEGMPEGPKLTVEGLIEDGFDSEPAWFFGLVAEAAGELAGHALCARAYSSWSRRAFYVEDLYVRPHMRRRGVGAQLMQHLCQMAEQEGVTRIDWHVLESNTPTLAFYAKLGARDLRGTEGRAAMRLDAQHIRRVAREGLHAPAASPDPGS